MNGNGHNHHDDASNGYHHTNGNGSLHRKQTVAVVGTGVAGLTAAYLLSSEYAVTVFECAETLGMDSASKTFAGARMDVPLRTFSTDYYPNLTALYKRIGVEFSHANYEFACFREGEDTPYFSYFNFYRNELLKRMFGYDVVSLPRLLSWNPVSVARYFSMLSEYYFFQKRGPLDLANGSLVNKTFQEYVLANHSRQFYEELLLPMLSVICTCSWEAVGNYPAEIIVDYLAGRSRDHPMGSTTMRATSGTTETVKRLAASFDRVLTSTRVVRVLPANKQGGRSPSVTYLHNGVERTESFDHVIMATQANAAVKILQASPEHVKALSGVKYEKSRTILHTDTGMVAKNFKGTCSLTVKAGQSDCTIWMNRIDPLLAKELNTSVFQTWNPLEEPRTTPVVDVIFDRPIMTLDSMANLDLLASVNGKDNVWFVGAYSLYSMPLLENGARSAIRVANKLLVNKYPELGVQLSGESFAKRRPDLVDPELATAPLKRKRSRAAMAVDGIVLSSYLAVIVGAASLIAVPLMRTLNRPTLA